MPQSIVFTMLYEWEVLRINEEEEWIDSMEVYGGGRTRYVAIATSLVFIMRSTMSQSPCTSKVHSKRGLLVGGGPNEIGLTLMFKVVYERRL